MPDQREQAVPANVLTNSLVRRKKGFEMDWEDVYNLLEKVPSGRVKL